LDPFQTGLPESKLIQAWPNTAHVNICLERHNLILNDPLVASGQMQLLNGDAEIAPGISVKVYPGHTRDLQTVMVRSGGRVACYPSDLEC
jgi:hypothetical protein